MNYSKEELAYILYNNRSISGVVSKFLPKDIDLQILLQIERKLNWCKKVYNQFERFIEIDKSKLDIDSEDVSLSKEDLSNLDSVVKSSVGRFSDTEKIFLEKRGITGKIITKYQLGGLSFIQDHDTLIKLNVELHPLLKTLIPEVSVNDGIIIPIFENGCFVNCAVRRISDTGKLKYSLTIPDIHVWGLDVSTDEVWICEGLFDMMALQSKGLTAVSVSSAMWSSIQLYKLLDSKPKIINILCDNDQVGYKTGAILNKFFNLYGIQNRTWQCKSGKDAAEIIFEKKLELDDIIPINITKEMLGKQDLSFDFLKYLTDRSF